MNSIQLAQRLARNLTLVDPTGGSRIDTFNVPADVALDVLSAINAGLNTFYRNMPGIYKRSVLSYTIRCPLTLTVHFVEQYSRLVAADTFSSDVLGCTVRFGNGAADTEVTGANSVLDDYMGTDLSVPATLYADAVPLQDVIERVIGNLRLYDNTQAEPTMLIRDERLRGGRARRWTNSGEWEDICYPYETCFGGIIGRPRYYYLDPVGASQGNEPEFLLRVAPLPDKDYRVRMEAELSTQRITFADLTTARAILVADSYVDDILIPLCEAELITSAFWRDKSQINTVTARQQNILASKMPMIPKDVAPAGNLVGTPRGF